MQQIGINNLVRSTTYFQHAGIAIIFIFMPIIARGVTDSLFEVGIIVASFSFAQILSEIYFGRISDRRGIRLLFIRAGFVGCAITFGLQYLATDALFLMLARLGAGVASGIMIPAMIAYTYETGKEKAKVASVISFHALGWLVGIVAAGIVNDERLIFLISAGFFVAGLAVTARLPNIIVKKELEPGTTKRIISKFKIGIGLTTFVFIGLMLITEWWMAIPFMALVGATWAFLFIGGNFYLMENYPKSTSSSIFSSTLSIATVIGPVIAGSLAFYFEYVSVMYFAIAIIICGFLISLKIKE